MSRIRAAWGRADVKAAVAGETNVEATPAAEAHVEAIAAAEANLNSSNGSHDISGLKDIAGGTGVVVEGDATSGGSGGDDGAPPTDGNTS